MSDEVLTRCPACGELIDPKDPDAIYGVEQVETVAMGPTYRTVDGIGGFFHEWCSPESVGYARRERPSP